MATDMQPKLEKFEYTGYILVLIPAFKSRAATFPTFCRIYIGKKI